MLRQYLFLVQLGMKKDPSRCLSNMGKDQLLEGFQTHYGVSGAGWQSEDSLKSLEWDRELPLPPKELYRHHYDIPWQTSITRAIDIIDCVPEKDGNGEPEEVLDQRIIDQLHRDFPMGRELFGLALEFFLRNTESARHRLTSAARQGSAKREAGSPR